MEIGKWKSTNDRGQTHERRRAHVLSNFLFSIFHFQLLVGLFHQLELPSLPVSVHLDLRDIELRLVDFALGV
jgi:hypothetical protein